MNDDLQECTKCADLVRCRQQVVGGDGPIPSELMVLARNPGKTENRYGKPLIGAAGSMENDILSWADFRRVDVYCTNLVKCWTPNDREPYEREIENCRHHLVKEIGIVKPKVIIATGQPTIRFFVPYLVDKSLAPAVSGTVAGIRGVPFRVCIDGLGIVVVPTYHPSYISRLQYVTKRDAKKNIFNPKLVALSDTLLAKRILKNGWTPPEIKCKTFCQRIELGHSEWCAFDLETTGLDPRRDEIIGFAVSVDGITGQSSIDRQRLRQTLESPAKKIAQNGPFDIRFAHVDGIKTVNYAHDTMMGQHCLTPDLPNNLGFINSIHTHFAPWKSKTKGKMHDTTNMDQQLLHERCCADAVSTYAIAMKQISAMKSAGLYEFYKRIYVPMTPIIAQMMLNGVKFDRERCDKLITHLFPQYKEIVQRWHENGVDIASNKQVGDFLLKSGVPLTKMSDKGKQLAVDDETLQPYTSNGLVVDVRRFRKLQKLLTTDLVGFRKRIDNDGYVRSDLDITGTGTGRFSSKDPDLQNVRLYIRNIFVARPGHYLWGADYKGMELFTATLLAEDYELLEELKNGRDVHEEMRRFMFGDKPTDDIIGKSQRRDAKTLVFGPLYGKTKYGLARDLRISQNDAEKYLSVSCTQRPKFAEWRALQSELAYGSGAVHSALGRRRLLNADRIDTQAFNGPVQMTAHDIVLESMILIHKELNLIPWNQVHDNLIYELEGDPIKNPDTTTENKIIELMTRPIPELNNHRFTVDTGRGYDWRQIDVGVEDVE